MHEMKIGDLVAYPSKRERQIHIGRVTGDYSYVEDTETGYPHRRPVSWLRSMPRTFFTQGALYEIGSALSLFQIRIVEQEEVAGLSPTSRGDADGESYVRLVDFDEDRTLPLSAIAFSPAKRPWSSDSSTRAPLAARGGEGAEDEGGGDEGSQRFLFDGLKGVVAVPALPER